MVSQLVDWCFKPSQPQRTISELKETIIVEWTNKAEIRPKEQSEKAKGCQENLSWNEIQLKGP